MLFYIKVKERDGTEHTLISNCKLTTEFIKRQLIFRLEVERVEIQNACNAPVYTWRKTDVKGHARKT